jgi:UDP-N-acetylmuramate dehydrogenase
MAIRLRRSAHAAPVTYQPLADVLSMPPGAQPTLHDAVQAVRTARGLGIPRTGPDTRQVGSVFTDPPVTARRPPSSKPAAAPSTPARKDSAVPAPDGFFSTPATVPAAR